MYNPQLETFIKVADAGSFSKAAEDAFITPTAVIKQINLLEADLGLQLFVRTHCGISLTESGEALYKDAKYLIQYSKDSIPCSNCRYCTAECPKNIAIPDYFDLYNNMRRLKNTAYLSNQTVYYANLAQSHGKASDCSNCGLCEKNCPQSLPVRELLNKVAVEME